MSVQDELRRMAARYDFSLYRSTLRLAACKIDELEREVERLKKEKENRC